LRIHELFPSNLIALAAGRQPEIPRGVAVEFADINPRGTLPAGEDFEELRVVVP
jgi:hypothetical protein